MKDGANNAPAVCRILLPSGCYRRGRWLFRPHVACILPVVRLLLSACSRVVSSGAIDLADNLVWAIANNDDPDTVRDGGSAYLLMLDGMVHRDPPNEDLLTRFLSPGFKRVANSLSALFATGVCLFAGYFSLQFVRGEYAAADMAIGSVPYWVCESILPLGFTVIGPRHGLQCLLSIRGGFAEDL